MQTTHDRVELMLPAGLSRKVSDTLEDWRRAGRVRRLWAGDATLWSGADEARWLGWLGAVDAVRAGLDQLLAFQQRVAREAYTDVLLLGMGGSSLGAEVLATTFGRREGWPRLHVLDSTDPQQIRRFEAGLDLARTLVIVASKSGSTLEPNILMAYFFDRMQQAVGATQAARHFVAVTDPGSSMQRHAEAHGFSEVFLGNPQIGGRYSVLSNFGMVPAAAIGIDLPALLEAASTMVRACGADVPPAANPGVCLGVAMGVAARGGRDKMTILAAPELLGLGAWIEQLVAESTGKAGRGIIPLEQEPRLAADAYEADRLFVHLAMDGAADAGQDEFVAALAAAGQPVVRVACASANDVAGLLFLWEVATAVAGAVLGINPFDQPDVEDAKIKARALTQAAGESGALPPEAPFARFGGISLFADADNAQAVQADSLAGVLRRHFARIGPGDYVALLAFIEQNPAHFATLQDIRAALLRARGAATTVQFGPRFLHSTGQAYKGGPNTGLFVQITADDANDVALPGMRFGFGLVKAAQARGDFEVLAERGRRTLRVHLGSLETGLPALAQAAIAALRDA
jgi:transaldolase/glucose-6-phosphate isomerase